MSRLDSNICRLQAQRACLNAAAAMIARLPGPVLELGLGNGRSYDHLREILPEREIYVFERQVAAHPSCIPDERHLVEGDFRETLPRQRVRLGARAALAHADFGTWDQARNRRLAAEITEPLAALMAPGGVIVSDQ
ncbi:MAG: class I SAM-dependent methyltransferase, partial [Kiloniellales bacterium]